MRESTSDASPRALVPVRRTASSEAGVADRPRRIGVADIAAGTRRRQAQRRDDRRADDNDPAIGNAAAELVAVKGRAAAAGDQDDVGLTLLLRRERERRSCPAAGKNKRDPCAENF